MIDDFWFHFFQMKPEIMTAVLWKTEFIDPFMNPIAKITIATVIVIIITGNKLRERSRKRPLVRKYIMRQFSPSKHLLASF